MATAAIKARTPNLGLGLLNFNFPNWGDDANLNMSIIDTAFAVFGFTIRGTWQNSTAYEAGDLVADAEEGLLYRALEDHTSAATGIFAADRAANPTFWEAVETTVSFVGDWQTNTVYTTNQFLIDGARYGVAAANFTSGSSYDDDVLDGNIITLIDLTNFGTLGGFDEPPEAGKVIIGDGVEWTTGDISTLAFPTGTKMLFIQTAAPVFWTKDTTHNNKALRIVNGTAGVGGTVAFTTAFASKSVVGSNASVAATGDIGATAITAAQMPSHTHSFADSGSTGTISANHQHAQQGGFNTGTVSANHTHNLSISVSNRNFQAPTNDTFQPGIFNPEVVTTSGFSANHFHAVTISGLTGFVSANHTHTFSFAGTTGPAGSSTGHDHTFTGTAHTHIFTGTPIDLAVQYVDAIICIKD